MRALLSALLVLPALALGQASVAAPRLLPYQGRLLKADGTPETGSPQLGFCVYSASTGDDALWCEAQTVPLRNGFYAIFLGAVAPFQASLFDGNQRWLGVSVDGAAELTPRQQIASVAYAITSTYAYQATSAVTASTAAQAVRAAEADHAASATLATNATHAISADTATRVPTADRATTAGLADRASLADTATNVQGGTVSASSVTATGDVQVAGKLRLASASNTAHADLTYASAAALTGGAASNADAYHRHAGTFRCTGTVRPSTMTVSSSDGDAFTASRPASPNDGEGWVRVENANLTPTSIILISIHSSGTTTTNVTRYAGAFEVFIHGYSGGGADNDFSFVVTKY